MGLVCNCYTISYRDFEIRNSSRDTLCSSQGVALKCLADRDSWCGSSLRAETREIGPGFASAGKCPSVILGGGSDRPPFRLFQPRGFHPTICHWKVRSAWKLGKPAVCRASASSPVRREQHIVRSASCWVESLSRSPSSRPGTSMQRHIGPRTSSSPRRQRRSRNRSARQPNSIVGNWRKPGWARFCLAGIGRARSR